MPKRLPRATAVVFRWALVAAVTLSPTVSPAQGHRDQGHRAEGAPPPLRWWEQETLLGALAAGEQALADRGIVFEASYTVDVSKSVSGGIRHDSSTRSLLDLRLNFAAEPLLGWGIGHGSVNFMSQVGPDASMDVGDLQAFSNVDADNFHQLSEFWYELPLLDERVRLKVGKVDANSEFASLAAAGTPINSSNGYTPTIFPFPSCPDSAMSVNLFATLWEGSQVGVGLYDGASVDGVTTGNNGIRTFFHGSTDYFLIGEVAQEWSGGRGFVGGWHHNGRFMDFAGAPERGVGGWYLGAEQTLYQDQVADDADLLSAFVIYGETDDDHVAQIERHYGGGLVYSSTYAGIPNATGLAVHSVDLSGHPSAGFVDDQEVAYELYHIVQLLPWLAVQPDVQFIQNPGGAAGVDDATVLTLRVRIDF